MTIQNILNQWPAPKEDWQTFDLPHSIGSERPAFLGTKEERRIIMRFYKSRSDGSLNGHVWFAECCFGPPAHVHGGITTFVFDEAFGCTTWMNGHQSVAVELTTRFLKMVPLNKILNLRAWITRINGDKVELEAELFSDEHPLATAKGIFKAIEIERFLSS